MENFAVSRNPDAAVTFAGADWLITPAALAVGERVQDIHNQKWILTLSGVVNVNLDGGGTDWARKTIWISPSLSEPNSPLLYAIRSHVIPTPPSSEAYTVGFKTIQMSAYASLNSIFDKDHSINAGFSVDRWRPHSYGSGTDFFSNRHVDKLFAGIDVDVAARDRDAKLYKVGYHITILGKIVFSKLIID